jgi:hypothetical protein
MEKRKSPGPSERITYIITPKEKVELKIMSILTKKTMSTFIRTAVRDKINEVKRKQEALNGKATG